MSNSTHSSEGSSIQQQSRDSFLGPVGFPSSSQRSATPGLSHLSSVVASNVAQAGTSDIPFVSHPYNQPIMHPPTAAIRGVLHTAGHSAQAMVPSNFYLLALEASGFSNDPDSLVPMPSSQAVGPYIDNRQYFTMASKYILGSA